MNRAGTNYLSFQNIAIPECDGYSFGSSDNMVVGQNAAFRVYYGSRTHSLYRDGLIKHPVHEFKRADVNDAFANFFQYIEDGFLVERGHEYIFNSFQGPVSKQKAHSVILIFGSDFLQN